MGVLWISSSVFSCHGNHRNQNGVIERRGNLNEQKLSGMKSRNKAERKEID